MSKYVLMHGTIVELSDDQLMHWKYIKKEKVNGSWRYYYDESELNKAAVDARKAQNKTASAAFKVINAEKAVNKAASDAATAQMVNFSRVDANSYKNYVNASNNLTAAENALEKARADHQDAINKANAAVRKYETKKITSFASRTISKGIVKVANFLSGLFKKKKK